MVCLVTSCLSGCSLGTKKEALEIYFLSCKPEVAGVWEEVSEAYEQETGVKLKVLTSSDGNNARTLKAELAKKKWKWKNAKVSRLILIYFEIIPSSKENKKEDF